MPKDFYNVIDLNKKRKEKRNYFDVSDPVLASAISNTFDYARQNVDKIREVANTLNYGMTQRKPGDVATWDYDVARQTQIANAQAIKAGQFSNLFNTREYAFDKAFVNLTGLDYLTELSKSLEGEISASRQRDEDARQKANQFAETASGLKAQSTDHYHTLPFADLLDVYEGDEELIRPIVEDWLSLYGLTNEGDVSAPKTWDELRSIESEDEYQKWLETLNSNWVNADWNTLGLTDYDSATEGLMANKKTVDSEIARRSEISAMQESIRNDPNYDAWSVYGGSSESEYRGAYIGPIYDKYIKGYDDLGYFINSDADWAAKKVAADHSPLVEKYLDNGYDYLTPDEIADYNALINAGRTEDAAHYLELLRNDLLYRRAMVSKSFTEAKATNPYLAVPAWMDARLKNVANIFSIPQQMYEALTGIDNPYSSAFDMANSVNWTGSAQLGAIDQLNTFGWLKTAMKYGYNATTGATDNAVRLVASGMNPVAALTMAGLQSGSSSLHESASRDDMSGAAKILQAIAIGAMEVGTEKIGLDALFSSGKDGATAYLKEVILSELGEESLNYAAEDVIDSVVAFLFGHEAEIKSGPEFWQGLLETGVTTALSAGISGAGGLAVQRHNTSSVGNSLKNQGDIERMLSIAEGMQQNTESFRMAMNLRNKQKNGGKITNYDLGKFVKKISDDIGEENASAVRSVYDEAIENRLIELGESPEDAKANAPAIRRLSLGEKMTLWERESAKWSDNATQVVKELSVAPTGDSSNWAADTHSNAYAATRKTSAKYKEFSKALKRPDASVAVSKASERASAKSDGKEPTTSKRIAFSSVSTGVKGEGDFVKVVKRGDSFGVQVSSDDGKTTAEISIDDVTNYSGSGVGAILEYTKEANHDMSAEEVNNMIGAYEQTGGDAKSFIDDYESAYLSGYSGIDMPPSGLSDAISSIAYEHGKQEATKEEGQRIARTQRARKVDKPTVGWLGDVENDSAIKGLGDAASLDNAVKDMTDMQQAMVAFGRQLAESAKINVTFYASKANEAGMIAVQNGSYDPNTHTIYLDINSGAVTQSGKENLEKKGTLGDAVGRVLGHEVTHVLESTSSVFYAKYRQAVKDALKAKGVDYATLIREKINTAVATGEKLTYAGAEAEVIADASEYMLQDSKFVRNMETGLKGKVKEIARKFLNKVNEAFRRLRTSGHVESRALRTMTDGVAHYEKKLQDLWDLAFDEMLGAEVRTEVIDAEAVADVHADIRYSLRSYDQHQIDNWSTSKTIEVYNGDPKQIASFVERSLNSKTLRKKLYFGKVSKELSDAIYSATGVRTENMNLALHSDEVLKIISDHGDEKAEGNRGQKAVNIDDFAMIVEVVATPDSISLSGKDRFGKPVIEFAKEKNGKRTVVTYTSEKHNDLRVQTMYISAKKRSLATPMDEQASINTPEASSGTAPTDNVPRVKLYVNPEFDSTPDGIEIDDDTESAYPVQQSIRTWEESDYVAHREEASERLAKTIGVTVEKAKKWIDDVNSVSAYILGNKARPDYIPTAVKGMSAFKSNPEYGGSIDMSTICAKRRLATGTLDAIQRILGDVVLTKDDFLHIREMMKERGHEVACGLCFVESSRKNLSKYNKQFLDQYKDSHPDSDLSMVDLNTVEGLERIRSNPETADVYEAYEKFMNKLAQRKPKLFEKRTEYNHEVLKKFKSDTTVGIKNRNGGLRLQSFSDFEIVHLIDMMQVITDMASVGLAGQAYTKVPEFAWALGNTGLKINLSLIAKDVDADGNLTFDPVEGMDPVKAKELRDYYSKNVGTIVVTFTDEQTIAAMKSDFIDYIIPFHRSQWQKSDYKKLGLPEGTKDYTLHQNEKEGRKRVKENYLPNAYWNENLSGTENARAYLEMCAKAGRTPKFAKFLDRQADGSYKLKADGSTDGYWKLLIDFKMYDNEGNYSKQMPVQPIFNMDQAMDMLKKYKGEHDTFPVAQDVVDDFVKEYRGEVGGVKNVGGRFTVDPVQKSRRDLPEDTTSYRDYLADADDSAAATIEEKNALTIYQKLLKNHAAASDAVIAAEQALLTAGEEDKPEARKALTAARAKQRDIYNRLLNVERTAHVQNVVNRTNQLMNDLSGKTSDDVARMIADRERKIESLKADITGLKGAARTQREADIRENERMIRQLKSDAAQALLKNSEKYNQRIDEIRMQRDLNIEIGKRTRHIKRIVKRLNDRIVHEEDYKNVKEPLKPAVHALVRTFIDGFGGMVFDSKSADRLRSVYDELAKEDGAPEFYSDDVADWLSELSSMKEWDALVRAEGGSTVGRATEKLAMYSRVAEIADHIYKLVTDADEIFINGKRESLSGFVSETGNSLVSHKDRHLLVGKARDAARVLDDLLVKGNLTPQYFFEHLKNSGMTRLFDGLMSGQREYAQMVRQGQETVADAKRRYNFYAWKNMKIPVEFKTEQGHTIGLTVPQMMWVYATAKREATNKLADTHHLDQGGFKYDAKDLPRRKGKLEAIPGSERLHKLSKADVEMITNALTAEQKACADELVSYLSNECAEQGNRASMELFGIRKYNEEYYFPFKTASDQRYQRSDAGSASTTNDARVKHTSFTHSLRRGANTPLVMGNFFDVIADHINLMATYSSFVVPIESMNRVLNTKINEEADGSGSDVTIRSLVGRKYGEPSQKYIADLLKDLNGGPQTDNRGKLDAGIRLFKKNAVSASLSVAVQQPTSYVRAFAFIDPKYFVHLTGERYKETMKRMMTYSGTAVLKEMGGFNVGMGKQAADWMANSDIGDYRIFERTKFLYNQKGLLAVKDNWIDFLTALPGFMDRVTWSHIWKAVEAEQADLHPEMNRDSSEFLRIVGNRFDDVINHTQVYDSIIAKSQNMRGKDTLAKMATAFMAESTINMNMYYSAFSGDHGKKQASRIVASVVLSNVLAAAAAAAISAWNKDNDERTAIEQYMTSFTGRMVSNLNPLGSIPYLSDIWSVMTGYEVERADMSPIVDLFKYTTSFFGKVDDGKQLTWRDYENFIGSWVNLTGVPGQNLSKNLRLIGNLILSKKSVPPASRVMYGIADEIFPFRDTSNTAYYERYLAALKDGDKQEQYDLKDYLMSTKGVKENTIVSGVRDAYKKEFLKGGISKEDAISFLLDNDLSTGDTAEKKKRSAFQYVDKWLEGTDGYSAYNTLESAFSDGNSTKIQEAWTELTSNGYTDEQVQTQTKTILRELVESGKITPAKATELLRKYSPYKDDKNNINKPKEWLSGE